MKRPNKMIAGALLLLIAGAVSIEWFPIASLLAFVLSSMLFVGSIVARHFDLRTFDRRTRGHCPECDYELRYNFKHGCPECGWRRHT